MLYFFDCLGILVRIIIVDIIFVLYLSFKFCIFGCFGIFVPCIIVDIIFVLYLSFKLYIFDCFGFLVSCIIADIIFELYLSFKHSCTADCLSIVCIFINTSIGRSWLLMCYPCS